MELDIFGDHELFGNTSFSTNYSVVTGGKKKRKSKRKVSKRKASRKASKRKASKRKVSKKKGRRGSALKKVKYQATGTLKAIIGGTAMNPGQMMKKIWDYIKKKNLKGKSGSGDTVKYKGRTYKGGQIIYCKDAKFKKLCGKSKISMVEIGGFVAKNRKRVA